MAPTSPAARARYAPTALARAAAVSWPSHSGHAEMSVGGSSKTAIDTIDSRARAASPAMTEARRCSNPPAGPLPPPSRPPRGVLP
uniref:Uncharacterized protein n=1 Tax=Human herpesvirus 1 TaxID=10298 RepID=A0A2Z4GZS4_HHV1|nr:hypothetical protein [Human alphaherpesvirus 1]